jgi:mRNA deadenylase 3'-5' endonuclease subunit Ccr4
VFRVATYNTLATAYIRPRFYQHCEAHVLDPAWRVPALARHVAALDVDLIGLQEVDAAIYTALTAALVPLGYAGHYLRKPGRKPDGCATFHRTAVFTLREVEQLRYADGSGHVALLVTLEHAGGVVGLANTHLKWAPPGEAHDLVEARELLAALAARPAVVWIACGDFNAKPDSAVIGAFAAAGYRTTHASGFTCNPNAAAKTIDYLCHTAALRSAPRPLPPIVDLTPLPSREQPSDHLAVVADFTWA